MRKRNLFVAAFFAIGVAVAFTSCGNDGVWNENGIEKTAEDDAQQIVLQVSNSGDGLMTRGGRPLHSSEAKQQIDEVKVLVCSEASENNVAYAATVDDWMDSGSAEYGTTTSAHGRETVLTIPDDDKLESGSYTIYAIGYSDDSDYEDLDSKVKNVQVGDTFNENLVLALESGQQPEEIFAGSVDLTVESGKGFRKSVVLNRQVAGAFFYVIGIPAVKDATKIQLVASNKNTSLVLGQFANVDLPGNGINNDSYVQYVINGAQAETSTPHIICQATLSDWFADPAKEDEYGNIQVDGNWKEDDGKYKEGSVFAGEFVIPFAKVSGQQTFTLQMVDDNGGMKREWKVKLPSSDGQTSDHTLWTWNSKENDFKQESSVEDSSTEFNIVRNHLYTIGKRAEDEPADPGTDPDEPQSLDTKQTLVLKVCDNWEVVHKMEIE